MCSEPGQTTRMAMIACKLGLFKLLMAKSLRIKSVPSDQFNAALAEPAVAQPRRILRELREPPKPAPLVPSRSTPVLKMLSTSERGDTWFLRRPRPDSTPPPWVPPSRPCLQLFDRDELIGEHGGRIARSWQVAGAQRCQASP